MKSIAVIGQGFVGGSLTTVFAERGFSVFVYDKFDKRASGANGHVVHSVNELVRSTSGNKTFSGVYFVCLPTPMFEDGEADLSIVESVLQELANAGGPE